MIGIYKITNKINQHCYIGQSRNIQKRWSNHVSASNNKNDKGYEYPLYRAFRKYGIKNFSFEILEECSIKDLNKKELFYIKKFNPEYNQTIGEKYTITPQKLTFEQVQEIQNILLNDKEGIINHTQLATQYGVHRDTIRDINTGRTWFSEELSYPLHISKFDNAYKKHYYCIDCGKEISRQAKRCDYCNRKNQRTDLTQTITRDELKNLIRTIPFVQIGYRYGVTDNAIRKWCDKYNLPRTKKEINSYSDEEWNNL